MRRFVYEGPAKLVEADSAKLSVRIERAEDGKKWLTVRDDRGLKLPLVRGATLSQEVGEPSVLTLQILIDGKRVTLDEAGA